MKRLGTVDMNVINTRDHFLVQSDSGTSYEVNTDIPYCTCPDWKKSFWPCKHILKVFTDFPAYGWEFLPKGYTDLPCFNLDTCTTLNTDIGFSFCTEGNEINILPGADEAQMLRCELLEIMKELQNDIYLLPKRGLLDL